MRKALVTGANGFIGSALCRRLLQDGASVRAMCRAPARGQALAEAGAEVVGGDVQDSRVVHRLAEGCDLVFHVAAADISRSAAYQYNVNVQGTRNVIHAAHKAGAERYVHVSTVAVYGYDIDGPIDEDQQHRPSRDDYYMQSKSLGEKAAWSYAERSGLPTVAVRPAFVYGPGSGLWSRTLYDICRRYPVPLIQQGCGHAHPIFIGDLVDLLVSVATHPNAPGNAFHAAPDPAPTWQEFLGYYAAMAGNTSTINLTIGALKPVAAAATLLKRMSGRPVDASGALQYMGRRMTYKMTRAAQVLGWRPRISLEEGMARTEPWLRSLGWRQVD
jgi:nucleoside-diphosphate-sugar epimerase